MTDSIFAVSSGAPPAAIAVLRLSGPAAGPALMAMTGAGRLPPARQASLRNLRDPASNEKLDQALVLWFPGPASATGEDLAELHLHGGRAVIGAVEQALTRLHGLRRAEPGEFTRRALANGRIDLAEAEGLGDLLMAETEAQRRAALSSVGGAVSRAIAEWNRQLLEISAAIEAMLDFADEDDVAPEAMSTITRRIIELADAIAAVTANPPVERLRDGVRVVLAGAPNAGKSTLLNALADREAAIVSPIAGTTRDRIEVPVARDGIAYLLIDMAGLAAATDDPIEQIGIGLAREAIRTADILILLDDTIEPPPGIATIRIRARADIELGADEGRLAVSARTGLGVQALWKEIATAADRLLPRLDQLVLNRRQRALCGEAETALRSAVGSTDLLIVAEQCRLARHAFDRITGASDTESMLDALFGRFCIGK
jgi:tRNA modification GTPase